MEKNLAVKKAEEELAAIQKEAGDIVSRATAYQVVSEKTYENGTIAISFIAKAIKRIEALRLFHTKPLNDQVKRENELHRGYAKPFVEARTIMDAKMLKYHREQVEKQEAEQEKIREEAEKIAKKEGVSVEEIMASAPVEEIPKTVGNTTVKKRWTFEIQDEAEVPRVYLQVSEAKIREAIRDGMRTIRGIKIFQECEISTR